MPILKYKYYFKIILHVEGMGGRGGGLGGRGIVHNLVGGGTPSIKILSPF